MGVFRPGRCRVVAVGLVLFGSGLLFSPGAGAATQHLEKHYTVKGRPVVVIENVGNGRIEVKSWKNQEIVVNATQTSDKVSVESAQVGDRIDVTSSLTDPSVQGPDAEADLQLTVPEETELKLKSYAGDVHLKEVSGYIIVRTTGGSLVCTQCGGKLDFESISGNAQILQPSLNAINLRTTTGNVLFDGDFVRTGLYSMKSGRGLVEVRFSGNDSFYLNAQTATGTVDNQAAAYLKVDPNVVRHMASRFAKGLFGTVGQGLAKVELSTYSGTIRILKRD